MNLTLLGGGIIGSVWAAHYDQDLQDSFRVWNRTPKPLPRFEPGLLRAIDGAGVVHIVVSDPPAVSSLLDQILPHLNPGTLVIQSSTISPSWSLRNETLVRQAGCLYAEAPFTGSKGAASQRHCVFYLGGEPEAVEAARPWLTPLSKAVLPTGTAPQAAALKLAMNLQISGIYLALCESLALARRHGLSDEGFFAALDLNVARSGLSDLKREKILSGDFSPHFSVKHMLKDLRLALETAGPDTLPVTATVTNRFEEGVARGWAELDFAALVGLDGTQPPRKSS